MGKSKGLGRGMGKGVSALIKPAATIENALTSTYIVKELPMEELHPNVDQPRKEFSKERLEELATSIEKYGLLSPISVKKDDIGYTIVAGERRFRAFQILNRTTIPAIITSIESDVELLEKALVENIQREDLNPIELANSYSQLIEECGYTQDQLGERIGKDRATISNMMRLLKLPIIVQDMVLEGLLTLGHSKVILALSSDNMMIEVAKKVKDEGLSVRATEELVRTMLAPKQTVNKQKNSNKNNSNNKERNIMVEDVQSSLREKYGTKVNVVQNANHKGRIEIEFYNLDDLNRVLELLIGD